MLKLAIENNVAWYSSIFQGHRLRYRAETHFWSTDAAPPPYHSKLVTRTRGAAAAEAQLARLAELARRERPNWSCKDSYDELPSAALESFGLSLLFRAHWYGWAACNGAPASETKLVARRVETPEQLSSWEASWRRTSPASQARVFPETLFLDASIELFTTTLEDRISGGFALNQSAGAVGLSNVFQVEGSETDAGAFIRECARQARLLHANRAVVGYGSEDELQSLARLGFVKLGPLAVWAPS